MLLMIDNYDSFTYNLVDYFGSITTMPIKVIRNDELTVEQIEALKPTCIVISPGPKTPKEAGVSEEVIRKLGPTIPILGVCLGHQAIGEVFGGDVVRAKNLMHGKTSQVVHRQDPLFDGIPNPFQATRYHSLVVSSHGFPEVLEPLGFAMDDAEIMALKHKEYKIYGLQFHPESICTPNGLRMLENFLKIACG